MCHIITNLLELEEGEGQQFSLRRRRGEGSPLRRMRHNVVVTRTSRRAQSWMKRRTEIGFTPFVVGRMTAE